MCTGVKGDEQQVNVLLDKCHRTAHVDQRVYRKGPLFSPIFAYVVEIDTILIGEFSYHVLWQNFEWRGRLGFKF